MTDIIIVGAGGHSKVVADSAVRAGFAIRGFVDDRSDAAPFPDYQLIGTIADLTNTQLYIPKNVRGGGGTSFQKALDWVHDKLKDRVSLCVFFTDGGAPNPKKPPYAHKFIWMVYDNPQWQQPFGKQINIS